jgi:hypothetical protein
VRDEFTGRPYIWLSSGVEVVTAAARHPAWSGVNDPGVRYV